MAMEVAGMGGSAKTASVTGGGGEKGGIGVILLARLAVLGVMGRAVIRVGSRQPRWRCPRSVWSKLPLLSSCCASGVAGSPNYVL